MKQISLCLLTVFVASAVAVAQQSLGDVARTARAQKPRAVATFHLEGDGMSLPESNPASASNSPDQAVGATAKAPASATDDGKSPDQSKKSQVDEEKQKSDEWNAKIAAQKKEVSLLQREMDVAQREQRLNAVMYYGNAQAQMNYQAQYMEDARKKQAEIDATQRSLDAAKEKLDDLLTGARRAGVRVAE